MMDKSEAMAAAIAARPDYSGLPLAEMPAFEFISGSRRYAIYADGRIDGAPSEDGLVIINRIPMMINAAVATAIAPE